MPSALARSTGKAFATELRILAAAEKDVCAAAVVLRDAEFALKDREASYLCVEGESLISGKNSEIREAQLFRLTKPEQILVNEAKAALALAQSELSYRQLKFRSLLAQVTLETAIRGGRPDALPEAG